MLFYLKTNNGHDRPVYPPARDRTMVERILERAGLRGTVADAPADDAAARPRSDLHVDDRADHNDRVVTARTVGDDLLDAVDRGARRGAGASSPTACTSTSRSPIPGRRRRGDGLRELGFTFGGVFPNRLHDCDVLRYQYLDRVTLDAE